MIVASKDTRYIPAARARDFAVSAFKKAGVREDVAGLTAKALWLTSLRGVDSHGMRLLPHYLLALERGRLNPNPKFVFQRTTASTGRLDADHSLGHAAGFVAMGHAIELAQESGSGFVAVRNSSHCGAMATYALEACARDMLGLAFTHATPRLKTPNAPRASLGTNPICFAAPMADEDPFCFDAAPTPFSFNKVKQYADEGLELPQNVAADRDGNMVLDASLADQLLPIGDYKGFGLSLMVEILTGLLSGMPTGPDVSQMFTPSLSEKRLLGQLYGAIRIDAFEDVRRFKTRLQHLVNNIRSETRQDPSIPIQVAGDPEKSLRKQREEQGIPFSTHEIEKFRQVAERLEIEPIC